MPTTTINAHFTALAYSTNLADEGIRSLADIQFCSSKFRIWRLWGPLPLSFCMLPQCTFHSALSSAMLPMQVEQVSLSDLNSLFHKLALQLTCTLFFERAPYWSTALFFKCITTQVTIECRHMHKQHVTLSPSSTL